MKTIITITTALGFIWLSYYSMHHKPEEATYSVSVFTVLDKSQGLKQRQAHALAYIYDLTPEDAAKPVNLFGE